MVWLTPTGTSSPLLGAVEYCQYLDANGSTTDSTIQNVWRLPEESELLNAFNSGTPSDWHTFTGYWSSTNYSTTMADIVAYYGSPSSTHGVKNGTGNHVRCVHS